MALFPSAPKVAIRAPSILFVGQKLEVEIDLTSAEVLAIDFVEIRVIGRHGWSVGSGKSRISHAVNYPELRTRMREDEPLPAGTTTLVASFTLPADVPPSHSIDPAFARVELRVRVSIPWWPDGRYKFVLPVRIPALPGAVDRIPVAVRSTRATAAPDRPRLELALASQRLIAGETVVGSCAVFHMDDDKPREVDLMLIPTFQLRGRGERNRSGRAHKVAITLPPGSAGTSVPFRFDLPRDLTPSFEADTHGLAWFLTARSGSFFGTRVEVSVPLEIVDASAAARTATLTEPPRLADAKVAAVLAAFAERNGWRTGTDAGHAGAPAPGAADDDAPVTSPSQFVEHDAGDCELRMAYTYRGEDGTFVVAQVAHPTLGLGLNVTPGSTLRHVFFHDIEAGLAAWDRAHHVTARSAEQTAPFLRAAVPAARPELGTLVRWDDDAIVFERKVVSIDEPELDELAGALDRLATAITAARAQIAPPPGLGIDLAAWRELAAWLRAPLATGDLSIAGSHDGVPVALGLIWDVDGNALGVRVEVGHAAGASAALRGLSLSLPRPALDALSTPGADRLVGLLTGWSDDVTDLRITDGSAAAIWRLPASLAVAAPSVRGLVLALRAVLAALEQGAGPYR